MESSDKKNFALPCILLLLLTGSGSAYCQLGEYNSPALLKKYTVDLEFDLKLGPVPLEKKDYCFRFWSSGEVIDIRKDSTGTISGELTCYARQYDEMNLGKRTFFSIKYPIESGDATILYSLARSTLDTLHDCNEINGWSRDGAGFTYIVEIIADGRYSFKSYFNPSGRSKLREAAAIIAFINRSEEILKLNKRYKSFSSSIPFFCYTRGTADVICKK